MGGPLIECVPDFSEGRRRDMVDAALQDEIARNEPEDGTA